MKKNKSRVPNSRKQPHRLNSLFFRGMIVSALIIVGSGFVLLGGRNSWARSQQPEGKMSPDGIWQAVPESSNPTASPDQVQNLVTPSAFQSVRLNMNALRQILETAPLEFSDASRSKPLVLTVPFPEGTFPRFRIVESPMMEPELAAQFPDIKTYSGNGIDDPAATLRFDLTQNGFHAIVLSTAGTIVIDPQTKNDTTNYISYYKRDYRSDAEPFECLVSDSGETLSRTSANAPQVVAHAGTLHTYRLALAATGQYTNRFRQMGDTDTEAKIRGFNAIVTTMNRVNAIFGREVGIRLNLIAEELQIIYPDPTTDPYDADDTVANNTNNIGTENQTNLDDPNVLGNGNYDIGHVFGNGGGGSAGGVGTVCNTTLKGSAFTRLGSTVGDPFDIDYVAHEIGHQFGASHTFNNNANGTCAGTEYTAASAYEPASGSTIMSYAGICDPQNLQLHSDAYFHVKSLEQIIAYVTTGGGNGCDSETATGNRINLIAAGVFPIFIPSRTPFKLDLGAFSDPDGDVLTYDWEEYDLGPSSPPEADNGSRPIFRSYNPTIDTGRTFPSLRYILNNANNPPATYNCGTVLVPITCVTGETLPTTTRTMTFQQTVRDNHDGVTSLSLQVNVRADSGPFVITQPNTNVHWTEGAQREVSWNPANTFAAPVDCANVRITLSTDGGITFPIDLAASTPNDGAETITLPLLTTATARIKVEAVGNIFFDISDSNFSITPPAVTNTNDSGDGSLRQAINIANSAPDLTVISFSIPGAGVQTINVVLPLPVISAPVVIDGWSQGGEDYSGAPLIELNGAGAANAEVDGLLLAGGNSMVNGLSVNRFPRHGILIQSVGGNVIEGCYIGTNPAGTAVLGNGGSGVFINATSNNRLGSATTLGQFRRNIFAGNNVGVSISGISATGNSLYYNYIGTNVDGARLSNTADGIRIFNAPNNIIGGTRLLSNNIVAGTGNVISGNNSDGIEITGALATGNVMQANLIGLTPDGTSALPNFLSGISIAGAPNNIIGGTNVGGGNVISGNTNFGGIALLGGGSSGTVIQGNSLGTTPDGSAAIGNTVSDIYVESANNLIGGTEPGSRNVISARSSGIALAFQGATGNVIQGNYIGTDASGTVALGLTGTGIAVRGANNNTIGGTSAAARNIISGNGTGIHAIGGTTNLLIQGNYIGTNPTGTAVVGNRFTGIVIEGSSSNTIGGTSAGSRNVISGNSTGGGHNGISISSSAGNTVQGNFIGTNAAGDAALGNIGSGIVVAGNPSSANNVIGGTSATARNIISANAHDGILVNGHGNSVLGNYIGTDVSGTINLGNGSSGIEIASGDNNVIGGNGAGAGNLIAFNGLVSPNSGDGVRVAGGFTDGVLHGIGNRIRGNSIFSNVRLGIDLVGGTENLGVTANDACDADTGANKLQNSPVLTAAINSGVNTTIQGTLNSAAGEVFTIDFYSNSLCDASGNGGGRTHLGSTTMNTDTGCSTAINVALPVGVLAGQVVTATATDSLGNTSEFSSCVTVQSSVPMLSTLQFSAANYDGAEDSPATVITVTRTGDSSGAVSVNYATSDGSALQRTDYTIALGTLNFASGETSRSFVVLITDDAVVEGTETANITLSNPTGGSVLGALNTTTLTILDDAVEEPGNPIDVAGTYVRQHYHDFLSREADAGGLAFWTNEITSCGGDTQCIERKRINVSAAFFLSIEFQQTGYLVYRFYNAALNRSSGLPRYLEFLRDTQTMGRGVVVLAPGWEAQLEANKVAFAGEFVARPEFTALYPLSQTPAQYVDALYAHAGIISGVAERQAALDEFAGAATSAETAARGRVLRRVTENQTFSQREFNRAFVLMQYFGYLRRNPDDLPDNNLDGYNFWLTKLNQFNGDFVAAEMVKAFINSGEYRNRFR